MEFSGESVIALLDTRTSVCKSRVSGAFTYRSALMFYGSQNNRQARPNSRFIVTAFGSSKIRECRRGLGRCI